MSKVTSTRKRFFHAMVVIPVAAALLFTPNGVEEVNAAATGSFNIGAYWQPPSTPTDYNTAAHWQNIADAHIEIMIGKEGGVGNTKAGNETAIANSYAKGVRLLVTDNNIAYREIFTTNDYQQLETALTPYKNDSRVAGIVIRDEPAAWYIEGYANSYRRAKSFAPNLEYYVNMLSFNAEKSGSNFLHAPPGKLALSNSGARGSGKFVTSTQRIGQTFKMPANVSYLQGIQLFLDASQWSTNEMLTLQVWDSPAKNTLITQNMYWGHASASGNDNKFYPYFEFFMPLQAGGTYYWELSHNGGGDNSVGWVTASSNNVYADGQAYENGAAKTYDFYFKLFTARENTNDIKVNSTGGGDNVRSNQSMGQTFTTPANVNRYLYYIQPYIDPVNWTSGQGLTMTLYDSPAKRKKIAVSPKMTSSNNGITPYFYMFANVASNTSYYWEITSDSSANVGWVAQSTSNQYNGGTAYKNGTANANSDMWFNIRFGSEYENYLDDWLNQSGADYLLFDNYMFRGNGVDDGNHFLNSELVRARALDHGVRYGAFLQSVGITRQGTNTVVYRAPTMNEMRYNVYTYLAYGFKDLHWFTYWRPQTNGWGEVFNNSPVDFDGTKLTNYNRIQTLNAEMKNLGETLKNLTSVAVYHTGTSIPRGTKEIADGFFLKPQDMKQPIQIGYFTNAAGRKYVMLVNRDYNNGRTLNFNIYGNPASVTEISKSTGAEVAVPGYNATTGVLNISLTAGEGRLFALPAGFQGLSNLASGAVVTATSALENADWGTAKANDVQRNTVTGSGGWTSQSNLTTSHTESITFDLGSSKQVSRVDLYPRNDGTSTGHGFPVSFSIKVSANAAGPWTTVATGTQAALPGSAKQTLTFTSQAARYVRVEGITRQVTIETGSPYRMQLAEVEIY